MPGKSTVEKQQNQTQSQNTQPWAPAVPLLERVLSELGGQGTGVTSDQSAALSTLSQGASDIPSFLPQATNVAGDLVRSTPAYSGLLSDAYNQYRGAMTPYLDPSYLDPNTNPHLSAALQTAREGATRSINDQFAAAGRDLSPAHAQALGRGILQAEAPILMGQYNRNVGTQLGAAQGLLGGGQSTASGLTGLEQTAIGNQLSGLNIGGNLGQFALAPGQAQLGAANQAYGLPFQNIGLLTQQALPIAALGSQSTGQAQTNQTVTQRSDPVSNITGGILGGLGLLGGFR